ncbi:GWxTD domain-containing protein [candidate division KSB1 bacterium]
MLFSIILSILLAFSPQNDKKEQAKSLVKQGYEQIETKEYKDAVETFNKAIKLDKNCKEAHLGKGIAYYKSGDYNRLRIFPEEYIKRALKIDPEYLDAKIHLGWCYYSKNKVENAIQHFNELLENEDYNEELYFQCAEFYENIENRYHNEKTKIDDILETIYRTGSTNPEVYYKIGWKYFLKDSLDTAIDYYKRGLSIDYGNTNYFPYLDLGIMYFNAKDNLKSFEYFDSAIKYLPDHLKKYFDNGFEDTNSAVRNYVLKSMAIKLYADSKLQLTKGGIKFIEDNKIFYEKGGVLENAFMAILSNKQKEDYLNLDTIHERKKYFDKYFMLVDTTPFSSENEVYNEFMRRFHYVLEAFKAATPYGFDDRGKVYLKYGEPEGKSTGLDENNIGDYVEEWRYPRLPLFMRRFIFASHGGPPLIPCKLMGSRLELYSLVGYRGKLAGLPQYRSLEWIADQAEMEFLRKELIENKIVTDYPFITSKETHLNFGHREADFKYSMTQSLSEIYFGINLENLKFKKDQNKYSSSIKFFARLIDLDLKTVMEDSVEYILNRESKNEKGVAVNQLKYSVPPGQYTLYVKMKNPEGKSAGVYFQDINIDEYNIDRLCLSDMQFSINIKEAQTGAKYVRNGLSITPYPFFEVSHSNPLFIYYEIYNLKPDRNGKTKYDITYEIRLLEDKESFWKKLFKGKGLKESISFGKKETGNKINTFDYTSFDMSKLRIGKYELKAKVKDIVSGKEVQKTDTFVLMK